MSSCSPVHRYLRRQIFADIANNAKGIRPDFKVFSDQRDVVNRIAREVATEHPLFTEGGVEDGQSTSMSASNPKLIGAKNVADIVRSVHVGVTGRVGRRVDDELSSNEVLASRKVKNFLDTLLASFPELRQIVNGEITPIELRKESMLGYGTIYRVLAGVYYELKRADEGKSPFSESEIREVLKKLANRRAVSALMARFPNTISFSRFKEIPRRFAAST